MRAAFGVAAAGVLLIACVACTSSDEPVPSTAPSTTPSASSEAESSAVAYDEPDLLEGELTRATYGIVDGVPTTSRTVSDVVAAGESVEVEGQCAGGESVEFTLLTASEDDNGSTLLEGSIDCAQGPDQGFRYELDYDGPTQLTLTAGPSIDAAWVVVRRA